jgi:Uma2 family endonuclease
MLDARIHITRTFSPKKLLLAEFMQRYQSEGPFEIISGEIMPLEPVAGEHQEAIEKIAGALEGYAALSKGEVFTSVPYVLVEMEYANGEVAGVRVPDVMFYLADRLATYRAQHPDWQMLPLMLVPDFVVEIMAESDSYSNIALKVSSYLYDGIRRLGIIDRRRCAAVVHTPHDPLHLLDKNGILTGGKLLPGFEFPLAQLFG